jgi:hypothetical protein
MKEKDFIETVQWDAARAQCGAPRTLSTHIEHYIEPSLQPLPLLASRHKKMKRGSMSQ